MNSNRRSSILKPSKTRNPFSDLMKPAENEDDNAKLKPKRRVSFANNNSVKRFATDLEKNTIWDSTYEESIEKSSDSNQNETGHKHNEEAAIQKSVTSNIYPLTNTKVHPQNTAEFNMAQMKLSGNLAFKNRIQNLRRTSSESDIFGLNSGTLLTKNVKESAEFHTVPSYKNNIPFLFNLKPNTIQINDENKPPVFNPELVSKLEVLSQRVPPEEKENVLIVNEFDVNNVNSFKKPNKIIENTLIVSEDMELTKVICGNSPYRNFNRSDNDSNMELTDTGINPEILDTHLIKSARNQERTNNFSTMEMTEPLSAFIYSSKPEKSGFLQQKLTSGINTQIVEVRSQKRNINFSTMEMAEPLSGPIYSFKQCNKEKEPNYALGNNSHLMSVKNQNLNTNFSTMEMTEPLPVLIYSCTQSNKKQISDYIDGISFINDDQNTDKITDTKLNSENVNIYLGNDHKSDRHRRRTNNFSTMEMTEPLSAVICDINTDTSTNLKRNQERNFSTMEITEPLPALTYSCKSNNTEEKPNYTGEIGIEYTEKSSASCRNENEFDIMKVTKTIPDTTEKFNAQYRKENDIMKITTEKSNASCWKENDFNITGVTKVFPATEKSHALITDTIPVAIEKSNSLYGKENYIMEAIDTLPVTTGKSNSQYKKENDSTVMEVPKPDAIYRNGNDMEVTDTIPITTGTSNASCRKENDLNITGVTKVFPATEKSHALYRKKNDIMEVTDTIPIITGTSNAPCRKGNDFNITGVTKVFPATEKSHALYRKENDIMEVIDTIPIITGTSNASCRKGNDFDIMEVTEDIIPVTTETSNSQCRKENNYTAMEVTKTDALYRNEIDTIEVTDTIAGGFEKSNSSCRKENNITEVTGTLTVVTEKSNSRCKKENDSNIMKVTKIFPEIVEPKCNEHFSVTEKETKGGLLEKNTSENKRTASLNLTKNIHIENPEIISSRKVDESSSTQMEIEYTPPVKKSKNESQILFSNTQNKDIGKIHIDSDTETNNLIEEKPILNDASVQEVVVENGDSEKSKSSYSNNETNRQSQNLQDFDLCGLNCSTSSFQDTNFSLIENNLENSLKLSSDETSAECSDSVFEEIEDNEKNSILEVVDKNVTLNEKLSKVLQDLEESGCCMTENLFVGENQEKKQSYRRSSSCTSVESSFRSDIYMLQSPIRQRKTSVKKSDKTIEQIIMEKQHCKDTVWKAALFRNKWYFGFFLNTFKLIIHLEDKETMDKQDQQFRKIEKFEFLLEGADSLSLVGQYIHYLLNQRLPVYKNTLTFHYKTTENILQLLDYFSTEIDDLEDIIEQLNFLRTFGVTFEKEDCKWMVSFSVASLPLKLGLQIKINFTDLADIKTNDIVITNILKYHSPHIQYIEKLTESIEKNSMWLCTYIESVFNYVEALEN